MRGAVAGLLLLSGCVRATFGEEDGLITIYSEARSSKNALLLLEIAIEPEQSALLLTATAEAGHTTYVRSLIAPNGEKVFDATVEWEQRRQWSNAAFASEFTNFNWPIRSEDTPLTTGDWMIEIGTLGAARKAQGEVVVESNVAIKSDLLEDAVALRVDVVLVGGIGADEGTRRALEDATQVWGEIYASHGIFIDVSFAKAPQFEVTAAPSLGDGDDYSAIAGESSIRRLHVVVTSGFGTPAGLYGMAGSIPGPLVPTAVSAVGISVEMHTGADGVFSESEIQMMGATMAHEAGHYLGLFHTVETSYALWDALDDTAECEEAGSCAALLGDNLMFPYPVCDFSECSEQVVITPKQVGVLRRYVGVE